MQLVFVIFGLLTAKSVTAKWNGKPNSTALVSENGDKILARCYDITAKDLNSTNPVLKGCAEGVQWAKTTGVQAHPEFYKRYANLLPSNLQVAGPGWGEFQCALWMKNHNAQEANGSEGHLCPHPCTPQALLHCPGGACDGPHPGVPETACKGDHKHCTFAEWDSWSAWDCASGVNSSTRTRSRKVDTLPKGWTDDYCLGKTTDTQTQDGCATYVASTDDKTSAFGGLAWYWIALIGFLVVCFCGGFVYGFFVGCCGSSSKKPEKKKRAIKKQVVQPEPNVTMPTPVATTAIPMPAYTYAASPVTTSVAPPVYMQAAPAVYAAPAPVSYAAPASVTAYTGPVTTAYAAPGASVSYAAPAAGSVSYAAPMQQAYPIAAEPVTAMFNALDANHDGSISRQEFAAAMGR
jgi:hypothetical protein